MNQLKKARKSYQKRTDITREKIQGMLDDGLTIPKIAKKFKTTYYVIKYRMMTDAEKKEYLKTRKKHTSSPKEKSPQSKKICTCCGIRPVGRGLTFLCQRCYTSSTGARI